MPVEYRSGSGTRRDGVCIHAGRVEIPQHLEWVLYQRYYGGYQGTEIYQQALDDLLTARTANAKPCVSAIRQSLNELVRYCPCTVATHLHDTLGLRDHLPPGQGNTDFNLVPLTFPKTL